MKQKNNLSEVVTKKFFLRSVDGLLQGIRNEIRFSADVVIDKLEKRMQETNDRNFTKLDSISKELAQIREDKIIGGHQVEEKLDNHEQRIQKLEQVQQIA